MTDRIAQLSNALRIALVIALALLPVAPAAAVVAPTQQGAVSMPRAVEAEPMRLLALRYSWPIPGAGISGRVGSRIHPVYGYRSCHTGIDIRGGYGTPIRAFARGVVTSIRRGGPYGLHTTIAHPNGLETMYAHQSRVTVRVGESVRSGEVIGRVGSSGWVTGPHLHFEVHVGGRPYNPMGWFGGRKAPVGCS